MKNIQTSQDVLLGLNVFAKKRDSRRRAQPFIELKKRSVPLRKPGPGIEYAKKKSKRKLA